jgi:hypothetical protein
VNLGHNESEEIKWRKCSDNENEFENQTHNIPSILTCQEFLQDFLYALVNIASARHLQSGCDIPKAFGQPHLYISSNND